MYFFFTHAISFILKLVDDNTRCYEFLYITLPLIVLRVQVVIFCERKYKSLGDFCLHRGTMYSYTYC